MLEKYFLGADDLEHVAGGPLSIEQPQKIITKPLSEKDQDDGIRMVFGLTSNDPLPQVDDSTFGVYHRYLARNLAFPFSATQAIKFRASMPVTVIGLGDSDDGLMLDETYGVLCEARREGQFVVNPLGLLESVKDKSNRKLIDDHTYWFHN